MSAFLEVGHLYKVTLEAAFIAMYLGRENNDLMFFGRRQNVLY